MKVDIKDRVSTDTGWHVKTRLGRVESASELGHFEYVQIVKTRLGRVESHLKTRSSWYHYVQVKTRLGRVESESSLPNGDRLTMT